MNPRVVDMYSGTAVTAASFVKAKQAGIWAIIHKVSEGNTYRDKTYALHRKWATDAGLLWGGYHFNYGNDVNTQVNNFLAAAEFDETSFICLDWEDSKIDMNATSAIRFMKTVEDRVGKVCALYSGNVLKQYFPTLSEADKTYIAGRKLWICQYGPKLILPKNIDKYGGKWSLWQYTGDGVGPQPHTVAGFGNGIDLSVFNGDTFEDFESFWTT